MNQGLQLRTPETFGKPRNKKSSFYILTISVLVFQEVVVIAYRPMAFSCQSIQIGFFSKPNEKLHGYGGLGNFYF